MNNKKRGSGKEKKPTLKRKMKGNIRKHKRERREGKRA